MSGLHTHLLPSRRALRVALAVLVVASLAPSMLTAVSLATGDVAYDGSVPESVPPTNGTTVVTADGAGPGIIAAYAPNGTKVYEDRELDYYHDVDPAPAFGDRTVTYVASRTVGPEGCESEDACQESMVFRVNLTTGERERVWSRNVTPTGSVNVHDVDFVNETHLLVADIAHPDAVYMVNVSSGEEVWRWNASDHWASTATGGQHPGDWTHLNDVEYVEERGLVMASPRNMDSVIFLRPGEGVVEELTLGGDGEHDVLYEAHNPDYIPASRGGPAVVIADSENDRILEFQRDGEEWERSWLWRDGDVEWPRDADRFPNNHTLVTDTHANRLVEVDEAGDVVWEMRFPGPYEAERLETGPESSGGWAADASGIDSRGADGDVNEGVLAATQGAIPNLVLNGTLFVLPNWVTPLDAVGVVYAAAFALLWLFVELAAVARRRYGSDRATTKSDGEAPMSDD